VNVDDLKGPVFHLNSFREHVLTMKQGLRLMGGDLVTGDGRALSFNGALKLVSHIYDNLPADKRVWGFHLEDAMETLRRVPLKLEDEDFERPTTE